MLKCNYGPSQSQVGKQQIRTLRVLPQEKMAEPSTVAGAPCSLSNDTYFLVKHLREDIVLIIEIPPNIYHN